VITDENFISVYVKFSTEIIKVLLFNSQEAEIILLADDTNTLAAK
jgi:hypothetical protein